MKLSVLSKISIGFVALLTTASITGAILVQIPLRQNVASRWLQHTHEVLLELETVLSNMADAETGQRGYLLTGDRRYLEPYDAAIAQIDAQLQQLKVSIADNPEQQRRYELLERQIEAKLGLMAKTIALRSNEGFEPAVQVIFSGQGKQQMDAIRALINEMEQEENRLLERRIRDYRAISQLTTQAFLILLFLSLVLICVVYYLVNSDITSRKRAEIENLRLLQQVQTERGLLETVLRQMPAGVIIAEAPSGKLILGNQQVEQIWRHSFLVADNVEQYCEYKGFHQDGRPYNPQEWPLARSILSGEVVIEEEIDFLAGDGTRGTMLVSSAPIRNAAGNVTAGVVTFHDISDRQLAEKELRRREAELRFLNEALPLGIFKLDSQGNCTYTNSRAQEICGFTVEEALETGWRRFIHPDDTRQLWSQWLPAVAAHQEFCGEVRYLHRDGTVRFGRVKVAPLFSRSEAIGYVGTIEDITEIRAIEKMKSEFISVVSHELRTPLASIRGAVGLLSAGLLLNEPETAQEMLEIASLDTERLIRLVNDILDLERLESNKLTLVKRWCDAAATMRQAVESLQPVAEENEITLSLSPLSMRIYIDPDRIIQILVNLLSNAIEFSPPGATVWLSAELGSGEWGVGSGDKGDGETGELGEKTQPPITNYQLPITNHQLPNFYLPSKILDAVFLPIN
ncbi:CHASE3 domain-containing protein [Chroococcidiopsis sp. CCNUC1]|uniref:CHASE3 domain-containing protein n=1 Tax=Chroococcidiopsis sp. CCNUC1 TaxID=2653189 RepID=UPI0020225D5D|nr:CHASE3 domain-containing protein [Chroococcidiopsis sp. CCNUC1]URD49048.1 CHASE3 domain-containing protein [Chroococcidiopsis sp. CCNUC1]